MVNTIVGYIADAMTVLAFIGLLIKPIREWVLGTKNTEEGVKCMLRQDITNLYYQHLEDKRLREYEYRNLCYLYKAYKSLKGNSFVDKIYTEMQDWKIVR